MPIHVGQELQVSRIPILLLPFLSKFVLMITRPWSSVGRRREPQQKTAGSHTDALLFFHLRQLQEYLSVGNKNNAARERHAVVDARLRQRCLLTAKAPTGFGRLVAQSQVYAKAGVMFDVPTYVNGFSPTFFLTAHFDF